MASLLIQTSFIGDVILTTPLIAELAQRGPVDVVVTPVAASVLTGNKDVRRLVVYDKRNRDRGLAGLRRLARRLAAEPDATAFLAQGSLRSALLARAAGYKVRIGFDTSPGRSLYTQRVPFRRDRHHAERLLRLAARDAAEFSRAALRPRLFPDEDDRTAVSALLERPPAANRPLIALAPGSVWATKRWPYFA